MLADCLFYASFAAIWHDLAAPSVVRNAPELNVITYVSEKNA